MKKAERQTRDMLRGFARTLLQNAQNPAWSITDLAKQMRTHADLAEAHVAPPPPAPADRDAAAREAVES